MADQPATAEDKIKVRLAQMDGNEKRLHTEALAEAYKDEVCPECDGVFLAFQHFFRCESDTCPMKAKDAAGNTKPSLLHQLLGPPPQG